MKIEKIDLRSMSSDDVLENMIRKLYHDGMNIFGPIREIVMLKLNSKTREYLSVVINYYLILIKNLRFYYLITQRPDFFEAQEFRLSDVFKEVLLDLKPYNPPDLNIIIDTELKCPIEPFYMVILNLLSNACRFGEEVCIEVLNNEFSIFNTSKSPLPEKKSVFELPVSYDKFNMLGAGAGLRIVKLSASYLNLKVEDLITTNSVKVVVNYSDFVV